MAIKKIVTKNPGVFKWEVRLRLDGRGSKRIRRRFERRVDAERYLEKIAKEIEEQKSGGTQIVDQESRTLRTESEYWLERRKLALSPASFERVRGILENELIARFGELPVSRFTVARVSDLQNELLRRGKAPRTVNREIGVLKAILNFSARHGRIPFNPTLHVKPLQAVKAKMGFWEPAEVEAFLSFTEKKYQKASERRWVFVVYLLAVNTGLRSGEIWGLKPRDLQLNRDLIHIVRQFDYVAGELRPCKGKSERYVPCHAALRQELQSLIEENKLGREDLIFKGRYGRPIEDHSFKRHFFRKDLEESGVKPIRFHDLRHTAATLMIASGIDLPTVQSILDHKDVSTTMLYVHLLSDSVQKVASRFAVLPSSARLASIE